ncbi:Neurogenic locus notch-like protein 4 [Microtus ochrogaster]|uniref:Neurogenic locus notch-like protein 4 n=1 Tax=Microtus ochrogaster TaxID=79684 RepID=A0A8J6KPZ0_MICOH|nr:Neurogenic locus notch-like protein 4 [Microtus ochrogaster]
MQPRPLLLLLLLLLLLPSFSVILTRAHQGPSPCEHGGSCLNTPGSFNCLCPPGYTGSRCEADHNECLSQPCHPGSTCLDLLATFHCICPPAHQGPSPCEHGGSCLNTPGSFNCLCPPGYTGSRCEADHNECLSQPCHPGSTCLDLLATFHCICPPEVECEPLAFHTGGALEPVR